MAGGVHGLWNTAVAKRACSAWRKLGCLSLTAVRPTQESPAGGVFYYPAKFRENCRGTYFKLGRTRNDVTTMVQYRSDYAAQLGFNRVPV